MSDLTPQARDTKLEALQKAARKRIDFFYREFARDNIDIRTGYELKFIPEENGKPVSGRINTRGLKSWLRANMPDARYIEGVQHVRLEAQHIARENNAYLYEIVIGESNDTASSFFHPKEIAILTASMKEKILAEALLSETCLHTPITAGMVLTPSFAAKPYPDSPDETLKSATIPMHFNVSLYQYDTNLFRNNQELMQRYADAIVEIQHDAGIALLPNENSLLRPRPDACFGAAVRDMMNPDVTIVALRKVNSVDPYLENRMAGADADPYVVMAVTLAAMYDAYKNPEPGEKVRGMLPRERATWVDSLQKKEGRLRGLLGDELYDRIQEYYTPEISPARG